jgi:uncharacterized protein with ATP-grasp and redox domains
MVSDYRCFFCFTKAYEKLLAEEKLPNADCASFTRDMANLYLKHTENLSAPVFSRDLHNALYKYTQNPDPHKEGKKQSNDLVLGMYKDLKRKVASSANPFDTALRLAIAGNIIDFAMGKNYDLPATIEKVQTCGFAIDHSKELQKAISEAKTVLYLGDNNGEIVFDKLFLETINHTNVYFAVRGAPVINDATLDDAKYVGINSVAKVISNGYDAASTIVEHCSAEFKELFNRADVIISKGQGNLEGLLGKTSKEVYFLLMVKCDVIADALHVKKGDFVVKKNNS